MTQDEMIKEETNLGVKLARDLMALGDQETKANRIEFKGGTWPHKEIAMGGMSEGSLASFFESRLYKYLPTEFASASQEKPTPSQSEPIYQFYNTVNGQWLDISKDAYSINSFSKKRIVYLQPQPQTVRE